MNKLINKQIIPFVTVAPVDHCKINVTLKVSTFECLCCRVTSKEASMILATIYRPSSVPSKAIFLKELLAVFSTPLTIRGDINLRLYQVDDVNTERMNAVLQTFDMIQHSTVSTHDCVGLLDVVVTRVGQTPTRCRMRTWAQLLNRRVIVGTKVHYNIDAAWEKLQSGRIKIGVAKL